MSGNRSKLAFFEGGWVTLNADFRGKGASPTNHCWCQKTRVIAVSCGIKIFAVRCLVLSQYTHLTDGQTDGQTDRQNFDSNTVRCITCSRAVKTRKRIFSRDNQPRCLLDPIKLAYHTRCRKAGSQLPRHGGLLLRRKKLAVFFHSGGRSRIVSTF